MDNFKNETISNEYKFIQSELTQFYNRPYVGMSEKNTEIVLKEIAELLIKLNY